MGFFFCYKFYLFDPVKSTICCLVVYYVAATKKSKAERIEEKKAERRAKEAEKTMVVESNMKQ